MSVKVHCKLAGCCEETLSTTKAVLIIMYDSNGLNIQKGWKREYQLFRILQPNGCKIRKSWDSQFSVEVILIPLLKRLNLEKAGIKDLCFFQISAILVSNGWNIQKSLNSQNRSNKLHITKQKRHGITAWALKLYYSAIYIFYYHIIYSYLNGWLPKFVLNLCDEN